MYDLEGLASDHDRLWDNIGARLRAAGVDAPDRLTRGVSPIELWTDPDLLLAQTCGYPLMKQLAGRVQVVATPRYRARGCDGPNHRTVIIVRQDDPRGCLEDFRGARCALNDAASNTGMNLLRAEIAPLIRHDGEAFFAAVTTTGSHAASLEAVAKGDCDIAAIDCVTFALLQRLWPETLAKVRVMACSARTPCLPMITALSTPPDVVVAIQDALDSAAADPTLKSTLDALLVDGFTRLPEADYRAALHAEQIAITQGYPTLQ
jgi:ABC-type phosphate/phosphonate transport system substrate-binding protein